MYFRFSLNESILCVHIRIASLRKENHIKLSQICRYGSFSKGLKNEFETAVVNEPSLKFYCIMQIANDQENNMKKIRFFTIRTYFSQYECLNGIFVNMNT